MFFTMDGDDDNDRVNPRFFDLVGEEYIFIPILLRLFKLFLICSGTYRSPNFISLLLLSSEMAEKGDDIEINDESCADVGDCTDVDGDIGISRSLIKVGTIFLRLGDALVILLSP